MRKKSASRKEAWGRAKAKADQLAAAGQDSGTFKQGQLQPNESVEFSFADQLIESFGYQPK